MSNMTV